MINSKKQKLAGAAEFLKDNSSLIILIITLLAAALLTEGVIIRPSNIQAILSRASIIGVVAIGHTFVILSGEIDLSTGALFGLVLSVISLLTRHNFNIGYAVILAILTAVIIGFINGIIVAKTKIPSFIMTLAMMIIIETVSLLMVGASEMQFYGLQDIVRIIFSSQIMFGLFPIIIWILIATISQSVLGFSRFGLDLYAVGGKESAAIHSGVSRTKIKILVFVLSGLFTGIAAVLFANKLGSGAPADGEAYLLVPIAAVILGGASLYGGEGNMMGTVIGVIVISTITNLMNLLRIDSLIQESVLAVIVLLFMFFNRSLKNYLSRFNRKHVNVLQIED